MTTFEGNLLRCAVLVATAAIAGGCAQSAPQSDSLQDVDALQALAAIRATEAQEQANLETFDDLDFNVYSGQRWDELSKSHATDIVVHWPDGRTTTGIEPHIADLEQQFVFAPDTAITEHPIKIAQGDWTAVMGTMTGTFTQPMPVPGAEPIPPTDMPFTLDMITIGRWENGVMKEEWLMWDNQAFLRQVGLAK